MQKSLFILVVSTLLMAATCSKVDSTKFLNNESSNVPPPPPPLLAPGLDELKWTFTENNLSVDFQDMNPAVKPKDDFFQFCNGIWLNKTIIPSTESAWGKFNILSDNNNKVIREILELSAKQKNEPGTVNQLIGDFYFTLMDSVKRDKDGINPIKKELAMIDAIKDKNSLAKEIGRLHFYGVNCFFGMGIEQDMKDNSKMIIYNGQGGLSLPSNEYYTKSDTSSEKIKSQYREHLKEMFAVLEYKLSDCEKASKNVYAIESLLADSCLTPVQERDIESQYNKVTWEAYTKMSPDFAWDVYKKEAGIPADTKEIIVSVPKYMKQFNKIVKLKSLAEIKDYLKWKVLAGSSNCLSIEIERKQFSFFGTTLRGAKQMKPLWKRAIATIGSSATGEALGHAFVDKTFSPEAKRRVNEMVDNIFEAFSKRLDTLEWMSVETRKKAHEKLGTFIRKLGYPDKWTDYSSLKISRNSAFENVLAAKEFQSKKDLAKLSKPIDKTDWGMSPHVVNAYYNPLWNEIVFPAGIMQPPFFDVKKEDAVNYARMGAVIGHELTHGFDDQGSQFDAQGNLSNWWLPADLTDFQSRTKKLVECFNDFEPLPGIHVNGELTLGENIADLGGLKIAYYAYMRSLKNKKADMINGFTPQQRFFIAFGQIWCNKYTEKALKNQIFTNVHSPSMYRVLGPLSNMYEFFTAFGIKEGDKMRRSEDKIARIW